MIENHERTLYKGASTILVYSNTTKDFYHSDFRNYLRNEEFICDGTHGDYGCGWVYVNIYTKVYRLGMPGVNFTPVVCDHAVTISEFKTIYEIYKKYEGKSTFTFYNERFDTGE